MLLLPDNNPKTIEYAKLVGTFDGVMWETEPRPILFLKKL